MKRSLFGIPFLATVLLSLTAAVSAHAVPAPFQRPEPPQCPYSTPDACMAWTGDGTGWPGADPSACNSGQCLVCALDSTGYREFCGLVNMSASCTCTIYKPEGSGPNITACNESGQCTYRH
jgi:hypothetical protein